MGTKPRPKVRQTGDRKYVGKDVWTAALERVESLYDRFDTVAVSFSGGKDSTATLQAVLEVANRVDRTPVPVVFYDEEAIPYQTEEYVRRVAERDDVDLRWFCLPIESSNACSRTSPLWYPWAEEDRDRWVRPLPPEAIVDLPGFDRRMGHIDLNSTLFPPEEYGIVAMCMGIRAAESITRHRAVTRLRKGDSSWIVRDVSPFAAGNVSKAYPVYDWSTEDVWTAPAEFGWDYNRAYDVMEMAGVSVSNQRCSPAFGNEPLQKLWTYKECFPELWEAMLERVPGVPAAARYALTELYSYGARPEKPDDVRWGEYLRFYLEKHEPKTRAVTAGRIRYWIKNHFAKTTDPIAVRSPHPRTGVSWNFLLTIAMRGDPKMRKQAAANVPDVEKARVKYEAEIESLSGRLDELKP